MSHLWIRVSYNMRLSLVVAMTAVLLATIIGAAGIVLTPTSNDLRLGLAPVAILLLACGAAAYPLGGESALWQRPDGR